jgi:hypothetical protein
MVNKQINEWVKRQTFNEDTLYLRSRGGGSVTVNAITTDQDLFVDLPEGAGGLIYWVEDQSTIAPNDTVPVSSFTPLTDATDADAAIVPKGDGALLTAIPDGTAAGGDKRGLNAVDLQTARSVSTAVASGQYSLVAGLNNTASGEQAVSLCGNDNVASAAWSATLAGNTNVASGVGAVALGGVENLANGTNSVASGGFATAHGIVAARVHATEGDISGAGAAQQGHYLLCVLTDDDTPTIATAEGTVAASVTNQLRITASYAYAFSGRVIAYSGTIASGWTFQGVLRRNSTTAVLVGAVTPVLIDQDGGAAAWAVAVTADTTLNCLRVTVTGAAATTICWVVSIDTTETLFPGDAPIQPTLITGVAD